MAMEIFFEQFGKKLEKAVKKDIQKALKEVGEEKVYAVALVTDDDCISLYLALNTYEYMKKKDEKYIELFQGDFSQDYIRRVKDGFESFTKWIPDEWGYSDEKGSELAKISELLFQKEASDSEEYAKYKETFIKTVVSAFKRVIEQKCFDKLSEEVTYFVSVSDGDEIYKIENYSAKLLNTQKVYKNFLEYKYKKREEAIE